MKSFLQRPGETVYLPNMVLHSVWNTASTVAVGDNPSYESSFDELFGSGNSKVSTMLKKKIETEIFTGDIRKRTEDVKEQVNESIRKNNILTYVKPALWLGMNSLCYNGVISNRKKFL